MRLYTLLKKDTKVILRSRLLLITLIVYPLLIVGIIGYAFSQPNTRVPIAVLNNDVDADGEPLHGTIGRPGEPDAPGIDVSTDQVLNGFEESGIPGLRDLADLHFVQSEEDGRNLLLAGDVQALIIFPKGFVETITSYRESAVIRIIVDQSDVVRSNVTEIVIRGIVQQIQERFVEQKVGFVVDVIEESLNPPANSRLRPGFLVARNWLQEIESTTDNETLRRRSHDMGVFMDNIIDALQDSQGIVESVAQPVQVSPQGEKSGHLFIRDLIIPAALGLSIFWTGTLATSSLLVYERVSFAYRRLGITPTSRATVIGSKVVLTSGIILVQSLFILIAAALYWNARVDNVPLTVALIVASTLASIGLGIFLGGISRDVNGTILLAVLVTFPMLFLSGLFYPVSFMPKGAQVLAGFFPLTYTVQGLRGSMLRGFAFSDAAKELLVLLAFALVLTALGAWLSRRSERRSM